MHYNHWIPGKIILPIILVFLSFFSVFAQLKSNIAHYSTEDGLSHDGVLCITQDRDGFMWFGTFDGLNRFDGTNFVVYKSRPGDTSNLRTNKIREIVEDKSGYLWVKTYDFKIYRFDKRTEQFLPISDGPFKSFFKDQVIIDHVVPDPKNGVWLLTENQGLLYAENNPKGQPIVIQFAKMQQSARLIKGNTVKFRYLDEKQRIWIGTEGGLNCLQRNRNGAYQVVRFDATVEKMLSSFAVNCVSQSKESLYFGTSDGNLLIYDLRTQAFHVKQISKGITFNSICYSKAGLVYISTKGKGMLTVDPISFKVSGSGSKENYLSLYEDRSGLIWIEPQENGILKYDPKTQQYKYFSQKRDFNFSSRDYSVVADANNVLWVSMKGGGFGYYNPQRDEIDYFYDQPGSSDQKFSNIITSLYLDRTGILWMSARDGGINKVVSLTDKFNYHRLVDNPKNRSENEVRAMMHDQKGRLWVCSKDGEVRLYENDKEIDVFGKGNKIGTVYSIIEDSKGNIWLGTKGDGLFKAIPTDQKRNLYTIKHFRNDPADVNSLSSDLVYSVIEDSRGRIWVGTLGGGINLLSYINGKEGFKNFYNAFHNYPFGWAKVIRYLLEDDRGRIWIATSNGLLLFDPNKPVANGYRFLSYRKIRGDHASLGNNSVQYIYKDKLGGMWIGTFGGGLNKVIIDQKNPNLLRFEVFTTQNGLANDVLLGMSGDKEGNIWIATERGLSKFNPKYKTFKNYDSFDGLPKVGFSEATCFTANNGQLYFGLTDGYIKFNPSKIADQRTSAKMALTRIQLYYKDIDPGAKDSPLKYAINETESLRLNYDQNVISIDYTVLDYRASNKITYAYKLEGFDKTWHQVNDLHKATYTNIPPGNYTFKVQATNDDLFLTLPEKTLEIIVHPPFYLSWVAYLIYFFLAIVVAVLARRIIVTMIRLRNKVLVEQKLTEVKLSFFTNISHELRTPLTLIVSPLEEISRNEKLSDKGREFINVIHRNANRMIRFTNQLLDFRKLQHGKMQLNVAEIDVVALSKEVASHFSAMAEEKHISFDVLTDQQTVLIWADGEKIEIILYNLLSNAFKFTPTHRKIWMDLKTEEETGDILIRIIDEGKGISVDKLEEIFEIYHEESITADTNLKGTGIGLALARGLALSHHGKLWAEQHANGGMIFTLQLKTGYAHFDASEVNFTEKQDVIEPIDLALPIENLSLSTHANNNGYHPQLLIVEDNPDLRNFLELRFKDQYRVSTAGDGAEGFEMALTILPDLIISDVMMPKMDGIQMLDRLKNDATTSHIPVILLTAKSSIESRIEGLKYGADIYLTKPFNTDFLSAAIDNLIRSRKKLFEQLSNKQVQRIVTLQPDEIVITSKDETFLKEIIKIVEQGMVQSDFNIDEVAAAIGMGRTTFYKKLKSLTALSPVEFVRDMRLKRSKQLLDSGEFTVSDAGYLSGFNSLPYFSTCFKEKYDVSPSAYLKTVVHS
jgi:signal transduction histidine kinase/ligand-binding sensor domain-containing protein/DNA-binding response OmpR family regulator